MGTKCFAFCAGWKVQSLISASVGRGVAWSFAHKEKRRHQQQTTVVAKSMRGSETALESPVATLELGLWTICGLGIMYQKNLILPTQQGCNIVVLEEAEQLMMIS